MAKYLIHECKSRLWYVNEYLVPSMLKQGIKKEDIGFCCDTKDRGNLANCMEAFKQVPDDDSGTWHLQDDVIISKDFKEQTEKHDEGIVCGFASMYDSEKNLPGLVNVRDMWFSFPCIRIPNKIARSCAEWIEKYMIGNLVYKDWWEKGVNDDMLFRQYIWQYHGEDEALNLAPNIVNHIDYLIGGSVNGRDTGKRILSKYWNDNKLIKELEKKLKEAGR